jgi:hypothetical protein
MAEECREKAVVIRILPHTVARGCFWREEKQGRNTRHFTIPSTF